MNIRYYIDPEPGTPHLHKHGVTEAEVEELLRRSGAKIGLTSMIREW